LRRAAVVAAVLVGIGLAGQHDARAQVVLDADQEKGYALPPSKWTFELKGGLFKPDVDGESGLSGKPYEDMFGSGPTFLPGMELDRFFLWPAGQLGLAAQIGYFSTSAYAFNQDPTSGMSDGTRSKADTTGFHIIPLSLSAVYRFTYLADKTVVPLVPYLKL